MQHRRASGVNVSLKILLQLQIKLAIQIGTAGAVPIGIPTLARGNERQNWLSGLAPLARGNQQNSD
jgi:hypothetical protein